MCNNGILGSSIIIIISILRQQMTDSNVKLQKQNGSWDFNDTGNEKNI